MFSCVGYAATAADASLRPFAFDRRDTGPDDVRIDILYCGVCHSDLHQARNEWHNTIYPCVPGHEIVGRVAETGTSVTRFKVGDMVGVGCMVDSCRECASCRDGLEQYCEVGFVGTYNGEDRQGRGVTFGGYSRAVVVDQSFVLRVPDTLDPAAASPLLCAGITTWSPLRHWKVGPGQRVGIVGLGGLGHMGVKFARALGAEVVLFTTSPGKVADGLRLGAHEVVLSKDADAMAKERGRFDFILDAVAADHDINAYLELLKRDGTMVQVGAPEQPLPVSVFSLLMKRRRFAGSLIGGIPETQEMLDFCGKHNITADIEMIRMDEIETAYTRMLRSDVKYRFVIDMATMPQTA
ncbi:NADP-dependent alcohol dehydrogenase C 1 [Gluconacetobacter sp. SXCC-1]|uniref:NAD(P)-dependent alcohol dehydrogenase n=1 Tax=Komagataeibacter rhaeticus TaxID=215221 RepID=A0A181CA19_9PROT|nr:NAD(P)-dependent alcohol dehydrogenase [Komagataeibacter rhaeticus]ATU73034.1 NAD(P)-dependent alcohol dehydrogenase [Komagataeibacter xylinus]EGG77154.1 NADP-dependent alcohol dehydrogenase C 1 [Gluconacetobacter sp. SXCC-1]QIP35221.1 NAD(P)-dependent alcohol dehydrogenase [Komagataeibacter rhaeticus]QOC47784.1 NAD(P)-dependent alcohol dehydrogenase [Komagataeibacter rhaeticus]WPP22851.1 NAD(P)-dependent alcohol dehydrogenase [Komagataeibacter rhaeticus]